jgi:divalent metal cation (Fe/Co/Zn/Cd) transporter
VLDVDELRLRWTGHRLRAEVGIAVDPGMDVVAAHEVATSVQHRLLHDVPRLVAATVHVGPHGGDHHAVLAHHPTALEPGAITR